MESVGSGMQAERTYLLPLAAEGFDLAESRFAVVDRKGCVQVSGNGYSVPLNAGTRVQVKVWPSAVEVWHSGQRIAVHERCAGRGQQILELTHYLDVLHRKPGAFAGSKPLSQWRSQGRWPPSFDLLWERLQKRHGEGPGTQQMVELLQLVRPHGEAVLVAAVEEALTLGCNDAASVQYLVKQLTLPHPHASPAEPLPPTLLGDLSRFERPLPEVASYDQLLEATQ